MFQLKERRSGAGRARLWFVALFLLGGALLATAASSLLKHDSMAEATRQRSTDVMLAIRTIDGLEWRAAAGEPIDGLWSRITQESARLRRLLAEKGTPLTPMTVAVDRYLALVNQQMAAAQVGQAERAKQMDQSLVRPAFDDVLRYAEELNTSAAASATVTLRNVRLVLWIGSGGIVALLGTVLLLTLKSRERSRSRVIHSIAERRFRSLVQSSTDVITIVAADGTLTVMSPTIGTLHELASCSHPTTITDLLPADEIERWSAADRLLRATGSLQHFDVVAHRDDLTKVWFEARGTPLLESVDHSVWTWRNISARKQLELELAHQAFHDTLTGLPNRALLRDRTEQALSRWKRTGQPVTLLFCDLDDFKEVNDTLGHAGGDQLLQILAQRLASCLRESDALGRFGGDEFVVVLEDHDSLSASIVAERMLEIVAQEVQIGDRAILPSISIGIASALSGMTTSDVLRNADAALYTAKRFGKGRFQVFTADMHQASTQLVEYRADLELAVSRGELAVHYQPTICLASGVVEGFEALVRWHHPTRGAISPATFIPVAEATGLILPIGRWVLQEACRTAVALQIGRTVPLSMHVNISPRQLHDPGIVEFTDRLLKECGLPIELLVLEVTEGILLDDPTAVQQLHRLRALGLRIAIDDFGTGYTSLHYLHRLPVDILKIDRSFVSGDNFAPEERSALLRTIVGMAKSLNLHTVAEGIETAEQLLELSGMGCAAGQGFLWSPAVASTLLEQTVATIDQPTSLVVATGPSPRKIG